MTPRPPRLTLSDEQRQHVEALHRGYRRFYDDPGNATPKIIIHTPPANPRTWEEMLADPLVMLQGSFDRIAGHLAVGDDFVPAVRVDFGTAQVAAAFGCELIVPANNTPAAGTHPLEHLRDVYGLERPSLDTGWFPKLREWTDIWLEHLPDGILFQQPDIQSPFNTAHLIRGNGILTDIYDDPEALDHLLGLVADYMIELIPALNRHIGNTSGWFADWGALWKGHGRLSNCTSDLIGPGHYEDHVLHHDLRVLEAIGGGRMHCCGSSPQMIRALAGSNRITGFDFDAGIHDPWQICALAVPDLPLVIECYGKPIPFLDRLLAGDWPDKRNITIITQADSVREGRAILQSLRESLPA